MNFCNQRTGVVRVVLVLPVGELTAAVSMDTASTACIVWTEESQVHVRQGLAPAYSMANCDWSVHTLGGLIRHALGGRSHQYITIVQHGAVCWKRLREFLIYSNYVSNPAANKMSTH